MLIDAPIPSEIDSQNEDECEWDVMRSIDSGCDGIPSYKMSSNDRWVVTPREIRAALRRAAEYPSAEWPTPEDVSEVLALGLAGLEFDVPDEPETQLRLDVWREWLAFLASAANRGGFTAW
jgi:hypothetical protein